MLTSLCYHPAVATCDPAGFPDRAGPVPRNTPNRQSRPSRSLSPCLPSPAPTPSDARPRKRKTRTFRPNYISFSGTYQCNLTCAHCCVPIEWPDRLDIAAAERFLEAAHAEGIATIGFTGGEPFLYPEFVLALTRKAAALGMRFDKVQTNGVWFDDEPHLVRELEALRDAGFTGKLGLSVDKFHGKHTAEAALFCRVARRVFGRDNIVSLSYASRAPDQGLEPVRDLARELDGVIDWSDVLHRFMLVSDELTIVLNWNHLAPVERAERLPGGVGRHLVRRGLLRGAGPGADRHAARARSSRAAASPPTSTN